MITKIILSLFVGVLVFGFFAYKANAQKQKEFTYDDARMLWVNADYSKIGKGQSAYVGDSQTYAAGMECMLPGKSNKYLVLSSALGDASVFMQKDDGIATGFIGGIGHDNVKKAALIMTTAAASEVQHMKPVTGFPYVTTGNVRFIAMTKGGMYSVELPEKEVTQPGHSFYALYAAGQDVITQYRKVLPPKAKE